MALKRVWPWLLLWAVFTGACASDDAARREERPLPPILFLSPVKPLLEHHEELRLSTEQLIGLGKLDSALQEKNKPLLMRLRELRPVVGPPRAPPTAPGPPEVAPPPPGVGPRPWGPSRRQTTWSGPRPPEVPPESEEARQQRLRETRDVLRQLDENASATVAEAEKLLDETQRARARELVAPLREEQRKARESLGEPPPTAPPANAG